MESNFYNNGDSSDLSVCSFCQMSSAPHRCLVHVSPCCNPRAHKPRHVSPVYLKYLATDRYFRVSNWLHCREYYLIILSYPFLIWYKKLNHKHTRVTCSIMIFILDHALSHHQQVPTCHWPNGLLQWNARVVFVLATYTTWITLLHGRLPPLLPFPTPAKGHWQWDTNIHRPQQWRQVCFYLILNLLVKFISIFIIQCFIPVSL